jgi:hypothetical protein
MSWGKIYCDTNWGENKYRTAGSIINEATPDCFQFPEFVSFKDHVRSEGATYEKMQCGIDILLFLGRSISITPQSPDNPTFSGILDTYTGATAGYSTRRLTNTYTGGLIRVRRSSDDAEQDIGYDANGEDLDIFGLLAFVNEDVTKADTDFSSGFADTGESGLDRLANQSIGERSGVLKATIQATTEEHRLIITAVDTGDKSHRLQTSIYIPSGQSGQTVDGFRIENGGLQVYPTTTTKDAWVDIDVTWSSSSNENIFIKFLPSGGAESWTGNGTDEVYIGDVTITQTTADGHITTWYDQTGNGNHATNSTASEQPLIVEAGDIIYEGATISRPAVDFDGVNDYFTASNLITELDNTDFLISVVSADEFSGGSEASVPRLYLRHRAWSYNTLDTMTWSPLTGQSLLSFQVDGATQEVFGNGTSLATASEAQVDFTPTDFQVGRYASTGWMDGTLQEIIIFNSDQSTNRTGIEGNIDNYFRITS